MGQPNNLVRLDVLLIAFGTVTGPLPSASLGTRLGTMVGLLLFLVVLGMLLRSNQANGEEEWISGKGSGRCPQPDPVYEATSGATNKGQTG